MKIAIDIDEVLADTINPFLKYYNTFNNTNYCYQDMFSYDFRLVFKENTEKILKSINDFYYSNYEILPMENSQLVVNKLTANYELVIITSRHNDFQNLTIDWVNKHYPKCFKDIFFAHNTHVQCSRKTKAKFCLENNVDYMLDDSLEHVQDCLKNNVKALLYSHVWNTKDSNELTGVSSWIEVLQHFTVK